MRGKGTSGSPKHASNTLATLLQHTSNTTATMRGKGPSGSNHVTMQIATDYKHASNTLATLLQRISNHVTLQERRATATDY